MAVADARGRTTGLVPGAHRVIRHLDAGEGPYAGALVSRGESVAVLIDAAQIAGWAGWEHAGAEHVAGPLDIARRADGHDVLLPWCSERVAAFLGRRAAAATPLTPGEATTMVASILRGLGELTRTGDHAVSGEWWLTDDGRPMFVIGAGEDARTAAARLIGRMQRECTDRSLSRLLTEVRDGLSTNEDRPGMPQRLLDRWESELFAIAAPRPIGRDAHAPERARDVDVARRVTMSAETRRAARSGGAEGFGRRRAASGVGRAVRVLGRRLSEVRVSLQDRLSDATVHGWANRRPGRAGQRTTPGHVSESAPPRDESGKRGRRGRMGVIAVAVAVVVLGVGLSWPGGAGEEPGGATDRPSATTGPVGAAPSAEPTVAVGEVEVSSGPSPQPSSESPDERASSDEPLAAARGALSSVMRCAEAGDMICAEAVAGGSTGVVEALMTHAEAEPTLSPVDQYGDVAVVRVTWTDAEGDTESSRGEEQMMVLARVNEKWLVRDAYDVADQPE
ncbi:hypothetical protein [Microbacterium phyllosphaerae]|uniref:hypothetical protein n=1 Tax=Microbacterium phyllosphaerae TaxID=124798 RepID=UPI00216A8A28|nr:hypothetical protein [Microbacterium phyllosphaerae]MCS3444276.1 hypothetical protein [Microbacterium phyllosphaerae]